MTVALRRIWRFRIRILCFALFAGLLGAAAQWLTAPEYPASAVVLVEGGKSSVLSIEDLRQPGDDRVSFLAQVEVLKSRRVANRTVQTLRLWERPPFDPRRAVIQWPWRKKQWTEQALIESAVATLSSRVKIDSQRTSGTIKISVETPNPQLSAMIVNEIAEAFIATDRELRIEAGQRVSASLRARLSDLRARLTKSESELQVYRDSNGVVSIDGSAEVQGGVQLKEITTRLAEVTAQRIQLESAYRQVQPLSAMAYGSVGVVQRDPGVVAAQERVNEAQRRVDGLSRNLGSEHSSVKAAVAELAATRRSLDELRRAVVSGIVHDYSAAEASEKRMARQLAEARSAMQSVNKQDLQLAVLRREVDNNRDLYEIFRKRATETEVATQVQASAARLIDRADVLEAPASRKSGSIAALAFGLAGALAISLSLAREKWLGTVACADEVAPLLGAVGISDLPCLTRIDRAAPKPGETPLEDRYAEGMHRLQAAVRRSAGDGRGISVLVAGAEEGVGATTIASSLAAVEGAMASTLLLEADLRKPVLARRHGLVDGALGLVDCIAGRASIDMCLHPVLGSNLMVMPAGRAASNPVQLLTSSAFRHLLEELTSMFSVVIVDAAPVLAAGDAAALAELVAATVLVIKADSTRVASARRAVDDLRSGSSEALGVVVNGVSHGVMTWPAYGVDAPAEAVQPKARALPFSSMPEGRLTVRK